MKLIKKEFNKLAAAVCIMLMVIPFLLGFDAVRRVTVKYDGQVKEVETVSLMPQEIIGAAGTELKQGDSWRIEGGGRFIHDGSVIEVLRAKNITVVKDGKETAHLSSAETVGGALDGLGMSYRKSKVYPSPETPLKEGMKIYAVNRGENLKFTENEIPVPVEYKNDRDLDEGVEKLESEGKPGRLKVISKEVKMGPRNTLIQDLGEEVMENPVPKVVRKGTAKKVLTPSGYRRYSRKMNVEATAYTLAEGSGTGLTSIGIVPYEGIVAVDPSVIPYYTKMYVPGYGIAMAGDCGGAIQGHIIDLYMEDWNRAMRWGRRDVTIYILED